MARCTFLRLGGLFWDPVCDKTDKVLDESTIINYCNNGGYQCPYKKQGNSGCYLTTACVDYKGLSDDCIELNTLRKFRDTYMLETEERKADVLKYYQEAPAIVDAINKSDNASATLEELYSNVIVPCVELIQDGEYDQAYQKYKKMVKDLKDNFS